MQVDPDNGKPATEQTEVRIVYNADTLYIAALCLDSSLTAGSDIQRRRDGILSSDDRFMWTIDTFSDAQSGYFFEMIDRRGAHGRFADGRQHRQPAVGRHLECPRAQGDYGWSIEVAIPFRSLNFDPNNDRWGINFQRAVRHGKEDSNIWMGWARNGACAA